MTEVGSRYRNGICGFLREAFSVGRTNIEYRDGIHVAWSIGESNMAESLVSEKYKQYFWIRYIAFLKV